MRVAIHQPEHLPWAGFFHKMNSVDKYVVLDTVQFTKNNFQNRNKIYSKGDGYKWLSVPVGLKGHTSLTIADMNISQSSNVKWRASYWGKLEATYRRHPYYKSYKDRLKMIVFETEPHLMTLNMNFIEFFREELEIETELIFASSLDVDGRRSELLANICKKLGAQLYLSGSGGREYLNLKFFQESNIEVQYQDYIYPRYESQDYIPYLSAIDVLMNCGNEARDIILRNNENGY